MRVLTLIALTGIAGWLAATGKNERSVELAAFVSGHQASWYETKNQATRVMEDASARLPAMSPSQHEKRAKAENSEN